MISSALIDGKIFAEALRERLAKRVARLKTTYDVIPGLAVVLVGEDPASQVYVRSKGKATEKAGMQSFEHRLGHGTNAAELLGLLSQLNDDESVDGILVQLPLPKHINSSVVIDAIDPDKDVDGFHVVNVGLLATGRPGLVPCTPLGCELLLRAGQPNLAGMHAVIVGRSNIVGRPMAQLLLQADCTVTIAHSKTPDLPAVCRTADILVAAVGKAEMIRGDWVKPGAIVIDVGINRITLPDGKTKLVGDVAFDEAAKVAAAITPVPGGVGPMTIACLLENTFTAACRRRGIDPTTV
jgi:methylenetetrahydrofolate dehydrogenase (NADP+) / methenyltetrahydrofolate cyclohydrolase